MVENGQFTISTGYIPRKTLFSAIDSELLAADLSDVKKLNLGNSAVTAVGISRLRGLPIEELSLASCTLIDDIALQVIGTLTELKSLNLDACSSISDAGIAYLRDLVNLKILTLRACYDLTDEACQSIAKMRLQKLSLSSCENITDAGLVHLSAADTLRDLALPGFSDITDGGLISLSTGNCPLERLALTNLDEITDRGISALTKIRTLKLLFLNRLRAVTPSAIANLKQELPQLEIRLS